MGISICPPTYFLMICHYVELKIGNKDLGGRQEQAHMVRKDKIRKDTQNLINTLFSSCRGEIVWGAWVFVFCFENAFSNTCFPEVSLVDELHYTTTEQHN